MDWKHLERQSLGPYQLITALSRTNGSPCIFRAQHLNGTSHALYVISNNVDNMTVYKSRFEAELGSVRQLLHEKLAAFTDGAILERYTYLAREYFDGWTLRDMRHQNISPDTAVTYAYQAAAALHYAHTQGVLHLDVRPAHVLIMKRNHRHAILAGFGLANVLKANQQFTLEWQDMDDQPYDMRRYGTIELVGYIAPEQVLNEGVDASTDVYSLACVLYEMLTGDPPSIGGIPHHLLTPKSILDQRCAGMLPTNPAVVNHDIMPELGKVVLKALERNPLKRFRTAKDFALAIGRFATLTPSMKEQFQWDDDTTSHERPDPARTKPIDIRLEDIYEAPAVPTDEITVPPKPQWVRPLQMIKKKPSIFISHSHEDKEIAARLAWILKSAGADVWIDFDEIPIGNIVKHISDGLAKSAWLVLIQSPAALQSRWVTAEWTSALIMELKGKMQGVIPFIVADCGNCDVSPLLEVLRQIDSRQDFPGAVESLLAVVGLTHENQRGLRHRGADENVQRNLAVPSAPEMSCPNCSYYAAAYSGICEKCGTAIRPPRDS